MPLPDQTGFVERLRGKATVHHAMGGDLDDAFLRELNDNIRSGLTEMLTKESKSFRPRAARAACSEPPLLAPGSPG